jgi:hypothetical protein
MPCENYLFEDYLLKTCIEGNFQESRVQEEVLIFPKSCRPKDQLENFTYLSLIETGFTNRRFLVEITGKGYILKSNPNVMGALKTTYLSQLLSLPRRAIPLRSTGSARWLCLANSRCFAFNGFNGK